MKKIHDIYVNKVVEMLTTSQLMEMEGVVVAGGFATALYHMHLLPEETKKTICKCLRLTTDVKGFVDVKNLTDRIGDIDYWILAGSEAEDFLRPWIEKDSNGKVKYIEHQDEKIRKAFKDKGLFFEKATRFSLSFRGNEITSKQSKPVSFKEQIIRLRSYLSVDDIFKDFDLSICRVGWYKGKLYVSSDAEVDFTLRTINANQPFDDYDNSFQRVWSIQRLFKYYKRYGFQPTKKTVEGAQKVFVEAIEFLNEDIEKHKKANVHKTFGPGFVFHPAKAFRPVQAVQQPKPVFGQGTLNAGVPTKKDDPYDAWRNRTVDQMRQYYKGLLVNINILLSFEEYKLTMATLLLDVEEPIAKVKLREYLESGGKKFQPEPEPGEILDDIFDFWERV